MRRSRGSRSPLAKLFFFVVGLATLYGGYYAGNRYAPVKPEYLNLHLLAKPADFEILLKDHYGNPFITRQLEGHWNLVLFGYTQAPDAAKAGLALVTEVKNRLAVSPELQSQTRAVLVTVNPSVDTSEKLHAFLVPYSPDFYGLTGTEDQVMHAARQLGVSIKRLPAAQDSPSRIDHGTSIALIGPDARLRGLFTGVVDAVSIATDIQKLAADLDE